MDPPSTPIQTLDIGSRSFWIVMDGVPVIYRMPIMQWWMDFRMGPSPMLPMLWTRGGTFVTSCDLVDKRQAEAIRYLLYRMWGDAFALKEVPR